MRGEIFWRRGITENRAHVQHTSAAALLEKLLDGGAIGIKKRCEVQLQREGPAIVADFVEWAVACFSAAAAGDVIEAVEWAEIGDGEVDGFGGGVGVAGVATE